MSVLEPTSGVPEGLSEQAITARNESSLSCKQTLAAIRTRSRETVQKRLGIFKALIFKARIFKAQSTIILDLLVPGKAHFGLKNLAYNLRHLVQLECHALAGAP